MRLLALDGNSILNRAYFGIKVLTTKDGLYTNGIYGFLNILYKLESDFAPDAVAVAFDEKEKTFRHKMYDGYKATRKPMPRDLAQQLPILKEILSALGYVMVSMPGYEADDILGTLARAAGENGDECYIATGDRDSLQLVDDNTKVILASTSYGKSITTVMDTAAVKEKYGLLPSSLVDLKALMGDSSDNIPGVKGVGEKTAADLLRQYGSLDGVYLNLDDPDMKTSVRNKLENDKEMAYLSRELGRIYTEVPIEKNRSAYKKRPADYLGAEKLLTRLEMYTMIPKFCGEKGENSAPRDFEGRLVTPSLFSGSMEKAIVGQTPGSFYFVWNGKVEVADEDDLMLKVYFEDEEKEKVATDAKRLYKFCFEKGIDIKNVTFCMTLAAYIDNPLASGYDLEIIAGGLGVTSSFECPLYPVAGSLQACYEKQRASIERENQQQLLYEIELPLAKVLANMEYIGFAVDKEGLLNFGNMLKSQIEIYQNEIYEIVGYPFNLNSPKQLSKALYDDMNLPHGKKTKSGYSTDAATLEKLKHIPVVDKILKWRTYQKLNSTYVDGMMDKISPSGRVYSKFNQTETRTGRISSSEPNLQNIPVRTQLGSEMRKFFVAGEGCVLVDADYSQIELRILAHLSQDRVMRQAFIDGDDIHARTAARVLKLPMEMVTGELRSRAKAVNFGIVYGMGAYTLSQDTDMTLKEAEKFIDDYLANFSGVDKYMKEIKKFARENGYVSTMYNRKRMIPEITNPNKSVQALGERIAMNTPVQGSSADIIKIAMVRVYNRLKREGLSARLILQVHDELIVEAPLDEREKVRTILTDEMQNAAVLSVPLKVDVHIGKNWYEAKG